MQEIHSMTFPRQVKVINVRCSICGQTMDVSICTTQTVRVYAHLDVCVEPIQYRATITEHVGD